MNTEKRLRQMRLKQNKTQTEIAALLNTTQGYYSKYELGKRELPLHHLKALCEYYNVSADYLLGFDKNLPFPKK